MLSLLVLVGNVAVIHDSRLAAVVGPLHGLAYLTVIVALLARDDTPARPRLLAVIPGVGLGYSPRP